MRLLDTLGPAKWPSLLLILVVPAWCFFAGWDSGSGTKRQPAGRQEVAGLPYQLWRASPQDGRVQWCAQPLTAALPPGLAFTHGDDMTETEFDAGQFCATLPGTVASPGLRLLPLAS